MLNSLIVQAPSKVYPIYFGTSLTKIFEEYIKNHIGQQVVIITNETVAPLYLEIIKSITDTLKVKTLDIILPDGEKYKTAEILNHIYDVLLANNIERSATLIALGGGVIGDTVGFAAATYQRGIPFIQIPTTLLSQVDSSVGGKTAINHTRGKNMIGAFYQPNAVFIGQDVLHTLPEREFSAGMAEVIKYALLGDVQFLEWLETHIDAIMNLDEKKLSYLIYKCCEMKANIVAEDEKENDKRALLNLGHTFAHVIEVELGYGTWLHGEAVSVGMILACRLSEELGLLSSDDTSRVCLLLKKAGLPIERPQFSFDTWVSNMLHDKKVVDGKMVFIVLNGLGHAEIKKGVTLDQLRAVITSL